MHPRIPPIGVLRLITRLNVGGPARHALLLTHGLEPRFATTLAAGTPPPWEGELSHPSVPVHHVPLTRSLNPSADARSLAAVRRLLVQRRPEVIHTHLAKAGTVGRLAVATMRPRPRTVHTFHGHVLDGYFRATAQRGFTEVERQLARHTDALVAVSPEIRDQLLDLGVGRPSQFHVIPLGLELAPFLALRRPSGRLRSRLGLDAKTPLVGIIGRLVPIKDHATLLSAVARLPGVHLAVIGDGELRAPLEARAGQLGLAGRVHFTGWWADIPSAVADLDVVALTSQNEGTPVALIEASAGGRPVVATDVGGVRTVVEDGVTGLLAPRGDAEKIASALARLLQDATARDHLGQAGRRRVSERFGEQRLLDDVRALYADLLGAPRGRRSRRWPGGGGVAAGGDRPASSR
ncbi:MAG: glycosyltransferase [Actinomycetota bacterium]|nr:glycosyltransferase [Actinomycetota bacterium]